MTSIRCPLFLRQTLFVIASLLGLQIATAVRAQGIDPNRVVGYSPTTQVLQGEPGVNFPQTYKLRITAPKNMTATTTVTLAVLSGSTDVTFYSAAPVGGTEVGSVNIGGIPNPATQISTLTFDPIPPGSPTSTPAHSIDVWVSLNLLPGAQSGLHAYQIRALGWAPAASNAGASINATVTYAEQKLPPTITITELKHGTTSLAPDGSAATNTIVAPFGSTVGVDVTFTAISTGTLAEQSDVTVDGLLDTASIALITSGTPRSVTASGVMQIMATSLIGTDHTFVARGTNEGGNGQDVATFRIIAAPTISLGSVAATYTGAAQAVTATTAPAGLATEVIYQGTGTTTYGPSTTAPSNAGTYTATAKFTNAAYSATASGTVTINQAPLVIAALNQTRVYGGALQPFAVSYTGFVGGDSAAVVIGLTVTSTVTANSGVGTHDIVPANATAANYAISFVKGTHVVSAAALTIRGGSTAKLYGAPVVPPTLSYEGLVNSDTDSVVTGLVVTSPVSATSAVGTYPITLTGGTAANYSITRIAGTAAVTPAPLTVKATNITRTYGESTPSTDVEYIGFVLDETAAVLGGSPAITVGGGATPGVGTYTIGVSQGAITNLNYTYTFVPGTLTVVKAPQAITFSPAPPPNSVTFGVDPFNLNATSATASVNPLQYSIPVGQLGIATVNASGVVTVLSSGTVSITVSQPGNENYLPAPSVLHVLVVNPLKVTPSIAWNNPADITEGTPLSGTQLNAVATVLGLPVAGTYTYTPAGGTVLPVGTHTLSVTFNPGDSLLYHPVSATVTINVIAAENDGCGTAIVRHAAVLNGQAGIEGSLHVLLPESMQLNGQAYIAHDLLMAGTPNIRLNGPAMIGAIINGAGAVTPSSHTLTLNGQAVVGRLVQRTGPVDMPVVDAPPASAGTRTVILNKPSDKPGSFATIRDLTVNGNYGDVTLPGGTYRDFTLNGNKNSLTLGTPGSTTPTSYDFRKLTINGKCEINVVGPVVITLANGLITNGTFGNSENPDWVELRVASGGVTLNGNASLYGFVVAPNGHVVLNGKDLLKGGLICDRLTVNGQGVVDLCLH